MNLKAADWYGLFSYLASGGATASLVLLGQTWPNEAKTFTAIGIIVIFVSGLVVRLLNNKTDAPATAVVADAPIVTSAGEQVGLNVSTTSTVPIAAPAGSPKP